MKTLLFLLTACTRSIEESETDDGAFALSTYDVPVGYESRTVDALNRAFYRGENVPSAGRALEGAAGNVIVAAPSHTQSDVAAVIDRLSKVDPKVAEPQNIRLSYWMVGARKAARADTTALPTAIAAAMTEVAASEAPMTYEVIFHEALLSLDGTRATAKGALFEIGQIATLTPQGSILVDVDIDVQGGVGTEARLQLVSGQVLVMGQTAGSGTNPYGEPGAPTHDELFYVVRPERVAAQ